MAHTKPTISVATIFGGRGASSTMSDLLGTGSMGRGGLLSTFEFTDEQWSKLTRWLDGLPQTARGEFENCIDTFLTDKMFVGPEETKSTVNELNDFAGKSLACSVTASGSPRFAARAGDAAFGKPLIENSWRSHVVEMIVESVLSPDWKWCAEAWSGWDFAHVKTALRLEIKQSAAKQSWKGTPKRTSEPKFSIRPASMHWTDGVNPKPLPSRAEIYVFAYHPIADATADHRDPLQWLFYVLPSQDLPEQKNIGFKALSRKCDPVQIAELAKSVEAVRQN